MKSHLKLEGLKEIEQALLQISDRSTRSAVLKGALRRAAQPMQERAKEFAPYENGVLEKSIKIGARTVDDPGSRAFAASMKATGGDRDVAVGALRDARRAARAQNPGVALYLGPTRNAFYAHFVEFGTAPHINVGRFAGSHHPGTAPDPFMRPAFDVEAQPTVDRLGPLMWQEIDKAAARAARKASKGK